MTNTCPAHADHHLATDCVVKLITTADWPTACVAGAVPWSDLDHADGFMHLSGPDQFLETANLHYTAHHRVLALIISVAPIAANLKWELAPKRGVKFPHLYGTCPLHAVTRIDVLIQSETTGSFALVGSVLPPVEASFDFGSVDSSDEGSG